MPLLPGNLPATCFEAPAPAAIPVVRQEDISFRCIERNPIPRLLLNQGRGLI